MDDVEEGLVSRAEEPVREDVRVRDAAVARDGVDRLDLFGAHLEEQLVRAPDDLVLVDPGPQHPVDLLVDRVDQSGRLVEQRDLLRRLDLARLEHDPRAVGDVDAGALQCLDRDEIGHVDAERLAREPTLAKLVRDPLAEPVGDPRLDRHRTAHRCDACAEVLGREPGGEELVMSGRGTEVPEDRVIAARQERETRVLVTRPLADMRARHIADVVRVEEEQPGEVGCAERLLRPLQTVPAEFREVDPLLPVHRPRGVGRAARPASHRHRSTS